MKHYTKPCPKTIDEEKVNNLYKSIRNIKDDATAIALINIVDFIVQTTIKDRINNLDDRKKK